MSTLTKETIQNLVKLSRIDCTEAEQEALLKDLGGILALFEKLQEIDTEHVAACNHVLEGMGNVMRDDKVGTTMPRNIFLSNAPSQTGGMIRVPPVMKSN